MVEPCAGSVVVLPFPFSDLSRSKFRPALVLASAGRGDWILCQITSNPYSDPKALAIGPDSFAQGSLPVASFARPGKLFTADEKLVSGVAGRLSASAFGEILDRVIDILGSSHP